MTDTPTYRPLGYDGALYYVLSAAKQQMQGYTAQQLMSAAGCMDIVGDLDYWAEMYAAKRGRVDWQQAGAAVMRQCLDAGLFDPTRVRGRGVWIDGEHIVVSMGGGAPDIPTGDYFYQARPALPVRRVEGPVSPILTACRAVPWAHPMHAELIAGWIALAPVCGALRVPHVRVDGRSAPALAIARAALGALVVTGPPGEDARPIVTEAWVHKPGHCTILSGGKLPDATALTVGDGPVGSWDMPSDMAGRLLDRQVRALDTLRHNLGVFADPLMAGAWSLYSTERVTAEMAAGLMGRYSVGETA